MSNKKRVLIIGIDGATFNIINPLLSDNKLPTFQKIINQGIHGILNSSLPLHSATGWTSLVTGKNSGKHNVYDLYEKFNGSYNRRVINKQNVKTKTLWDILGEHNRKSVVMNIPVTYPPTKINGIMVSGMLTPPGELFTYPEHLSEELYNKDYIIDIFYHYKDSIEDFVELAFKTISLRKQAFTGLLKSNDWDFSIVDFTAVDRLQRTIWQRESQIQKLYIKLDSLIGEILEETVDDNTYVMIISNHGFKSISKKFFVNEWLWESGLLSKKVSTQRASIPDFWEYQYGYRRNKKTAISKFLATTKITKDNIRSLLPDMLCELIKKATPASSRRLFPKENLIINWDYTKAYFSSQFSQGININLKGREPRGIVKSGKEYEQLRDQVIHELYRLKDPQTFENVIDEVYRGEDIFFGEYEKNAPDIVFVPHNYNYVLEPNKRTSKNCICYAHDDFPVFSQPDSDGIFLMTGPRIKKGIDTTKLKIFDIAPTVLSILDIPVPTDMDGTVMSDVLECDEYISLDEHEQADYSYISDFYDDRAYKYGNLGLVSI